MYDNIKKCLECYMTATGTTPIEGMGATVFIPQVEKAVTRKEKEEDVELDD